MLNSRFFLACVFIIFSTTVNSASIYLDPLNPSTPFTGTVSIDLLMDFSDEPTLGGGVDVSYDSNFLNFTSFAFDSNFLTITDSSLTCPGTSSGCGNIDQPGTVFNIAFGNFAGIGGPLLVGTMSFDIVGAGATSLLTAETSGSGGPFVSASSFEPQAVTYLGTTINVQPVPLPGAAWLFISGLGMLGFARKRSL